MTTVSVPVALVIPVLELLVSADPKLDRLTAIEALARLATLLLRAVSVSRSGGVLVLNDDDAQALDALAERCSETIGALAGQELRHEPHNAPPPSKGGAAEYHAAELLCHLPTDATAEACDPAFVKAFIGEADQAVRMLRARREAAGPVDAAPPSRGLTGEDVSRVLHLYAAACLGTTGAPLFSGLSVRTFAEDLESCADLAGDANKPAEVKAARERMPARTWEHEEEHVASYLLDLLAGGLGGEDIRTAEDLGEQARDPAFVRLFLEQAAALARRMVAKPSTRREAPRRQERARATGGPQKRAA